MGKKGLHKLGSPTGHTLKAENMPDSCDIESATHGTIIIPVFSLSIAFYYARQHSKQLKKFIKSTLLRHIWPLALFTGKKTKAQRLLPVVTQVSGRIKIWTWEIWFQRPICYCASQVKHYPVNSSVFVSRTWSQLSILTLPPLFRNLHFTPNYFISFLIVLSVHFSPAQVHSINLCKTALNTLFCFKTPDVFPLSRVNLRIFSLVGKALYNMTSAYLKSFISLTLLQECFALA